MNGTFLLVSNGDAVPKVGAMIQGRSFASLRIAFVTTAGKDVPSTDYLERTRKRFRDLGVAYEELDIEGKTHSQLRAVLSEKDAVYVEGGNTFYLLKAARESGFEKVLREFIPKGLIYIGASAGAYLATPTIEPATWMNRQNFSYHGLTDFIAFGFVPFCLFGHFDTHDEEAQKVIREKALRFRYPFRFLNDGQGFLVQNGVVIFVGEGSEVVL